MENEKKANAHGDGGVVTGTGSWNRSVCVRFVSLAEGSESGRATGNGVANGHCAVGVLLNETGNGRAVFSQCRFEAEILSGNRSARSRCMKNRTSKTSSSKQKSFGSELQPWQVLA